jgi:hypothetical protein
VKIEADCKAPFVDVATINRPDDLDDIAKLGLTVDRCARSSDHPDRLIGFNRVLKQLRCKIASGHYRRNYLAAPSC